MDRHGSRAHPFLRGWFLSNSLLAGLFALLWLVLRSGSRPSRLVYPCQQAALGTASLAFGAPLVMALLAARRLAGRLLGNGRALAVAAVGLFVTLGLWGFLARGTASSELRFQPPPDYRAAVFHVTDCPQEPAGDRFGGLDNLLQLMGRHGLKLYRSGTTSWLSGPDGLIASDDLVVIKINYQWPQCGGTNVDLLRGLVRALVDHPDGFTGEVVVGENTQFVSSDGFDRMVNNAQDRSLSPHDVVLSFQARGFRVSHSDWRSLRSHQVDERSSCDAGRGYVVLPSGPAGPVSYPKFETPYGTCVSLRDGVWNPDRAAYERDRLKVINVPVLKPHGAVYGVTGCVKNYMGVVTTELDTGSHYAVIAGLMGAVMAEIGPPVLNILDCIWVNGHPGTGPDAYFSASTRTDQLVASTDPVAADIWATTNILIPAFLANGYTPPWPDPDPTPEDPDSVFRRYLDRSMDQLLAGGYRVTNDLDRIDVYSWDGATGGSPRRTRGRFGP